MGSVVHAQGIEAEIKSPFALREEVANGSGADAEGYAPSDSVEYLLLG
jgi:hypothetical protein